MSLEQIRKKIVKEAEDRHKEIESNKATEDESKKFMKMAEDYFKNKNYSMCFYSYVKALKYLALVYVSKKIGNVELDEQSALTFLAKKEKYGLTLEKLEDILMINNLILMRKEAERAECIKLRKIIEKIKGDLF